MPKQTKDFIFNMPLVWYRTSTRGAKEPYHFGSVQIEAKGYKDSFGDFDCDLEDFKVTEITQVEFMKNWPVSITEMAMNEDF